MISYRVVRDHPLPNTRDMVWSITVRGRLLGYLAQRQGHHGWWAYEIWKFGPIKFSSMSEAKKAIQEWAEDTLVTQAGMLPW